MGWLRKRFGEQNTAVGAGIVYFALRSYFPQHAPTIDVVAGMLGVGMMATPQIY